MAIGVRLCLIVVLFAGVINSGCAPKPIEDPAMEIMRESARRGNEAIRRYRTADYQTAKSVLLDYLQFLDKLSSDPNRGDVIRSDAIITCVRLAKLEEKNHGTEQATYMKEAVARCQKLKSQLGGCSEDKLRRDVDRMDELPMK